MYVDICLLKKNSKVMSDNHVDQEMLSSPLNQRKHNGISGEIGEERAHDELISECEESGTSYEVPYVNRSLLNTPDHSISNVSESLMITEEADVLTVSAEDAVELSDEDVLNRLIEEKRSYESSHLSISQNLDKLIGTRNRLQNSVESIKHQLNSILNEISLIEKNSTTDEVTADRSSFYSSSMKCRGPPLPSQDELFRKAGDNGQIRSHQQYNQQNSGANYRRY